MEITQTAGRKLGLLDIAIRQAIADRIGNDRGEGVISMAIAVLIVAALGAAMWIIFEGLGTSAGERAREQVDNIGG